MANFVILNNENIVTETLVVTNDVATSEQVGIDFLKNILKDQNLKIRQTSYNTIHGVHTKGGTPFRGNYADVGFTYDEVNDVFYRPRPVDVNNIICDSWTISAPTWEWEAPTPMPTLTESKWHEWDEVAQVWIEFDITTT
tara:strand:- start:2323 stop:2742 length:420 start_codon:yes stop_codon:yes gene_type:complete